MLQRYGEASDGVQPKRAPRAEGGYQGVKTRALQANAGGDSESADHDARRVA